MLIEQKSLKTVEINVETGTINVCWANRIVKDGQIIHEAPHRCAYDESQYDKFAEEVDGGGDYLALVSSQKPAKANKAAIDDDL